MATLKKALRTIIDEVTSASPMDFDVGGVVVGIVSIPPDGGFASVIIQYMIHESITHQTADVLRDVVRAIESRANDLDKP
jgi:hypothetical protein